MMKKKNLQMDIRKLLKKREAILLCHYYQRPEIQEIADILGDSLALSQQAAKSDANVLVVAGVHFMAESASILSPEKTVLLPRTDAGCPLADMITPEQLETARRRCPSVPVVAYNNSSAAVKALSDVCCTSANALRVVDSLVDHSTVLMVPDGNLARHTGRLTGKKIISWEGYCPVHHYLSRSEVLNVREAYPDAAFAAHPECQGDVLALADFIGSTEGILRYANEMSEETLIVGTEKGVLYQLKKQNPQKKFILASEKLNCETMKSITLQDILDSLTYMRHEIRVPEVIALSARKALERMLQVS